MESANTAAKKNAERPPERRRRGLADQPIHGTGGVGKLLAQIDDAARGRRRVVAGRDDVDAGGKRGLEISRNGRDVREEAGWPAAGRRRRALPSGTQRRRRLRKPTASQIE